MPRAGFADIVLVDGVRGAAWAQPADTSLAVFVDERSAQGGSTPVG